MKLLNLFKKRVELVFPEEHEARLLTLVTREAKAKTKDGPAGSIIEKRRLWNFIAEIFPETALGKWEFDLPCNSFKRIIIKQK